MDVLDELAGWQADLRAQFPIIVANPGIAYLDSAATSQKPAQVLTAMHQYLTTSNANAGRGSYPWANATTALIEQTRNTVRAFLHDPEPDRSGVHFVSGATEGLRRVATDWLAEYLANGPEYLADSPEILVPYADHQANLAPWEELATRLAATGRKVRLVGLPYDPASGDYDHRALPALISERTRFVAATHVHHVYGGDMNIDRIRSAVGPEVPICLDATQSVGHLPLSVADLDVDFVVFSGHKALALPGTGVIWSRNRRGPAFALKGWPGTPNTIGVISLNAALDWLERAGVPEIQRWTTALAARLTDALADLPGIEIAGCQRSLRQTSEVQRRIGIVTFRHHDIPADDLGFVLTSRGLLVRADTLCQGGRNRRSTGAVRVSLHIYNTLTEINRLLEVLSGSTIRGNRRR